MIVKFKLVEEVDEAQLRLKLCIANLLVELRYVEEVDEAQLRLKRVTSLSLHSGVILVDEVDEAQLRLKLSPGQRIEEEMPSGGRGG